MGILEQSLLCMFGLFIGFLFIDDNRFGRKTILKFGFLGGSIASFLCFFFTRSNQIFFLLIGTSKCFINLSTIVLYILTSELYDSSIRVTAMGFLNLFCKIGGVFMPQILDLSFQLGNTGPFAVFALVNLINVFLIC